MPVAIRPVYRKHLSHAVALDSVRRLCGMSLFGKEVAINSRFHFHHVNTVLFVILAALVDRALYVHSNMLATD